MNTYIESIKNVISKGNTLEVLKMMENSYPNSTELMMLRSRYNSLISEGIRGSISLEGRTLELEQIRSYLLNMLDSASRESRELVGTLWQQSYARNEIIYQEMKMVEEELIVHDCFFLREREHKWEKGIEYCLKNNVRTSVKLILADPKSSAYKNRKKQLGITDPKKELSEHFEKGNEEYDFRFEIKYTKELFTGPFVLIDGKRLFMGLFLPSIHVEDAPFLQFWKTNSGNAVFKGVKIWLDEVLDTNGKAKGFS